MPVLQRPDSAARRLQQCRQGLSASLTEMRHELEALERQAPPLKPSRAASANATTPTTPSSALIRRNSLEPVGKLESSNNITAWDKERPPQLPPVQRGGDPTPVESPKEAPVVTKVETDRVNSLESNRLMEEQCHGTVRSMEQELPALCALSAQLARVVGKECSNTGLLLMEHYDLCEWMRPVPNYVAVPRLISSMGMAISRELLWDLQATLPPHPPPQSKLDEAARAMKQIFSNKRDTRGAESKKARLLTSLKPFEAMMAQADLAGDGHGDAASGTASGLVKTPPQLPGHVVQLSALIGSDPVSRMTTELVASNSQLRTFTSVSAKLTRRLKKLHERGEHDKASELSTEIGELYDGAMELHKRRLNDGVMYAQTETDMLRAQVDEWAAAAVPQVGAFMDYHERLTKVCQGDLPLVADRMNEEKQNTKRINEALLHDTRSIQSSLDANATDLDKCCMQLDDLLTNAQTLLDKRRKLTKQHIAAVEKARLETATITKSLEVCQRHADSIKQVKQHSSKCLALGAVCSTIINQGAAELKERLASFTAATFEAEKQERTTYNTCMQTWAELKGESMGRKENLRQEIVKELPLLTFKLETQQFTHGEDELSELTARLKELTDYRQMLDDSCDVLQAEMMARDARNKPNDVILCEKFGSRHKYALDAFAERRRAMHDEYIVAQGDFDPSVQ